jgi:general secretion pathway protein K
MKRRAPSRQRGAALLLAMLILTLVATMASGMVWQQWRAIRVEGAERARTQSAWILLGALDWARLILREDARTGGADHLGEPWAVPLAEARLSTFLAADRDNNSAAESDDIEAFLSGSITDAQSRWNLRKLVNAEGKADEAQRAVLARLCEQAGLPSDSAARIESALLRAWGPAVAAGPGVNSAAAAIAPQRLAHLAWLGIDSDTVRRLEPWVTVLERTDTTVNINTAAAEVIAAVVEKMSLGGAQRLVQERQRAPFKTLDAPATLAYFPPQAKLEGLGVSSNHFIVQGRLRLGERVLEERSLVERRQQLNIVVLSRERINLRDPD